MSHLKIEEQILAKYKAGQGGTRWGGKQRGALGPSLAAASQPIASVPIEEGWYYEGSRLKANCPHLPETSVGSTGSAGTGGGGGGE